MSELTVEWQHRHHHPQWLSLSQDWLKAAVYQILRSLSTLPHPTEAIGLIYVWPKQKLRFLKSKAVLNESTDVKTQTQDGVTLIFNASSATVQEIFPTGLREPKATLTHGWTSFITSLQQSLSASSFLISFGGEAQIVFITATDNSHVGNEGLELTNFFTLASFQNSKCRVCPQNR